MSLRQSFNKLFHSRVNPTEGTTSAPPPEEKVHPDLDNVEDSKVRIGLETNLFAHADDSVPIVATCSGRTFHNLQVRGPGVAGTDVVLEDRETGKVVAVIEHRDEDVFDIFSSVPSYTDEERANPLKFDLLKYNQGMYKFAQVKQRGKAWDVVLEGDVNPTYVIHNIMPHSSRHFPMTHVIRKGEAQVASTRYGAGKSFILKIDAGVDPSLMICLAIIADEADKSLTK